MNSVTPLSVEELAEALQEASAQGAPLVPWGAGTRQHIGGPPPEAATVLHTTALDQIIEHVPADMTVTVQAGLPLGTLQAALGEHNQWLPWDAPAAESATIGGLLATASSGPLRLGYGTPRDWVLGMRAVLGDGRVVKSGGRVVKNVAGYDSHKLHIGALGTLGVIAEVTFKVFPLPEASRTALFLCRDQAAALRLSELLRARPLSPISLLLFNTGLPNLVELTSGAFGVAVQFAGVLPAVERQLQLGYVAAGEVGAQVIPLEEPQSDAFWQRMSAFSAPSGQQLVIRVGVHPSSLGDVLTALTEFAPPTDAAPALLGYAGVGILYGRWPLGSAPLGSDLAPRLDGMRATLTPHGGYAVVEAAPPPLHRELDLWGPVPQTLALMRSLRQQWDPQQILNRGRYLV